MRMSFVLSIILPRHHVVRSGRSMISSHARWSKANAGSAPAPAAVGGMRNEERGTSWETSNAEGGTARPLLFPIFLILFSRRALPRDVAAVHHHRRAGDEARFVEGEEQRHAGDVLRLAYARQRLHPLQPLQRRLCA